MLQRLYIKNYALIDKLEIDFTDGFSVITGETGAGKSIILGGLSLILGQRADLKSMKQGEDKCIIEGEFDVSNYDLKSFCETHDIDYDQNTYILRREILSSGKSRAFINDSPATLTAMRDLGSRLIDIHSQHQNLLLVDDVFQLQVVDTLSNNKQQMEQYGKAYVSYKDAEKELQKLKLTLSKANKEEEFLRFQYEALNVANLKEGEQEDLEIEQQELSHAEEIKSALYKSYLLLSDEDRGVVTALREALSSLQTVRDVFEKSVKLSERIETSFIDLQDLSSELEVLAEDVEFNPERLQLIEDRLSTIYSLQKRFSLGAVSELISLRDEYKSQLDKLDSSDMELESLTKRVEEEKAKTYQLAKDISRLRKDKSTAIEKELIARLSVLGMPNVQFKCHFEEKAEMDETGIDDIQFLFSANKNSVLQPVAEIASGGEISRFMLCLKSMIAGATALPSIIFDEVDTGVSGEVADKMGNIMQEFGKNMQVIAITHLPQIAAKGKVHYKVYKTDDEHTTTTHLIKLSEKERLEEIAGMLSGSVLTEAALDNAREMLKQ